MAVKKSEIQQGLQESPWTFALLSEVQGLFWATQVVQCLAAPMRATLSISRCLDVEKRMMIARQGLKDLVGMKLTEEDVDSLACAFSLSTCPGAAEKYVVHYLTTSEDVSAVGLLQDFQANYAKKLEQAGPQLQNRTC